MQNSFFCWKSICGFHGFGFSAYLWLKITCILFQNEESASGEKPKIQTLENLIEWVFVRGVGPMDAIN